MDAPTNKTLWELLWDYDPNGLLATDRKLTIQVVNPAFCRMFKVKAEEVIGQPASIILSDAEELARLWTEGTETAREKAYPERGLCVRQVVFTIEHEGIFGCIMVDLTDEWRRREEVARLKKQTIQKVQEVLNNQMKAAQEIASLLGETTAESKVSLLNLVEMMDRETGDD